MDYYFIPEFQAAVTRWWQKEMPGVDLKITQMKKGTVMVDTSQGHCGEKLLEGGK